MGGDPDLSAATADDVLQQSPVEQIHLRPIRERALLSILRLARCRVRLLICEIDELGLALHYGLVDAATAVRWAHQINALDLIVEAARAAHDTAAAEPGDDGGAP